MPTLALSYAASSTVEFVVGAEGADGTNDVQIAIRPDFKYCVCPIMSVARGTPLTIAGLNQATSYYARIRSRSAAGVIGPWSAILPFRTSLLAPQVTAPASVMIKPAVLVVPNKVVQFVAAPNTIAGYPVENLTIDAPVAWRSYNAATHSFTARMAPEPMDTVALMMSNAPEAATVLIRVGSTPATADVNYGPFPFRASANLPGRPGYHGLFSLPALVEKEYWRVDVTAGAPGNVFHLEHVVFGRNRTSKNHSYDKAESTLDLGSLERTRSGNPNRVNGYRMRKVDFDLSMMSEAQYETQYADLHWKVGGTDPVFVVPNSRTGGFLHDRMLYGPISAGRVVNPASPVYTRAFTIDSLI